MKNKNSHPMWQHQLLENRHHVWCQGLCDGDMT
jgi:hypothetical protein